MFLRVITLLLKLIPLITLYKGVTSGADRMKPLFHLGKVVVTQFELKHIMMVVMNEAKGESGESNVAANLLVPERFSAFLKVAPTNRYIAVARQLIEMGAAETPEPDANGNVPEVVVKAIDFSKDVWSTPFKLMKHPGTGQIYVCSAGPDKSWDDSDDIQVPLELYAPVAQNAAEKVRDPARARGEYAPEPTEVPAELEEDVRRDDQSHEQNDDAAHTDDQGEAPRDYPEDHGS